MIEDNLIQARYVDFLKLKYHVTGYKEPGVEKLLCQILRNANIGLPVTAAEFGWLRKNHLYKTIEIIRLEQDLRHYQNQELRQVPYDFNQLKTKYKVSDSLETEVLDSVRLFLWKLEFQHTITTREIQYFEDNGLLDLATLAQEIQHFYELKLKYWATQHPDFMPDSPLYRILRRLEEFQSFSKSDEEWLLGQKLVNTFKVYELQKEFIQLRQKYNLPTNLSRSTSEILFPILQKIDTDKQLSLSEREWLSQQEFHETIHYILLKQKYQANEYKDISLDDSLYNILKKLENRTLSASDITWLQQQKLSKTVKIAQTIHCNQLQKKYRIINPSFDPFYLIMLKLERGERLERTQVARLIHKGELSPGGKIAIAHHTLEARFYEQEYKRTGNKWNIPSAVSEWRKAGELEQALQLIKNINFDKVPGNDLKAALLTNRGFVLRDLGQWREAETAAKQAMDVNPTDFHPYLLMATLCFQARLNEGKSWLNEAEKRGAELDDTDYEMKRLVKNTKESLERQAIVKFLLKEDPVRYTWAKLFLQS